MRIFNRTNEDIVVNEQIIQPENWTDLVPCIFDTISIHAAFGSAKIICEYTDRFIHYFGGMEIIKKPDENDIKDIYDVVKKNDAMEIIGYTENDNIVVGSSDNHIFYLTMPDCKEKVKVMNEILEANGSSNRIKPVVVVREGNCDKIYYLPQKKEE